VNNILYRVVKSQIFLRPYQNHPNRKINYFDAGAIEYALTGVWGCVVVFLSKALIFALEDVIFSDK